MTNLGRSETSGREDGIVIWDEPLTVRDHRGNVAKIPGGGTARQVGLEAAWWWGYTITRQSHFSVAKDGEVVPYDERPEPGEYELVEVGGVV